MLKRTYALVAKVLAAALLTTGLALADSTVAYAQTSSGDTVGRLVEAGKPVVTSGETFQLADDGTVRPLAWRSFTWGTLRSGDCTMFQGATWTLYSDGHAYFDAVVTSSDDNDAWLMWLALQDRNRAFVQEMRNYDIHDPADRNKFIKNLPDNAYQYRWFAHGQFNANWFWIIENATMRYRC